MKNKPTFLISLVLLVAFVSNLYETNMFELPKHYFVSIFLGISVIAAIIHFFIKGKMKLQYNKTVFVFLGLWFLSLTLSTIFSIAPELSFWGNTDRIQGLLSHIIYLGFFLIFLNFLRTKAQQELFLKVLIAIASITAIHAIFQQFGIANFGISSSQEFDGRSFSTLGHPVYLGQFLIFPVWAALYFSFIKKGREKIPYIILSILLAVALFLTRNRASILGFTIGIILFAIVKLRVRSSYKIFITICGIALFTAFIIFFASSLRSLNTRLLLWQGALDVFPKNFIFGSGLETFKYMYQQVASPQLFILEQFYNIADRSHNEYLDILVMQGIAGIFIYLTALFSVFISFFKKFVKNIKNTLLVTSLGALTSILISLFFSFQLTIHHLLFMAFLAIVLNNLLKFKAKTVKLKFSNILIACTILGLSSLIIVQSINAIRSDIYLQRGLDHLYADQAEESIPDIEKAIKLNSHQDDIFFEIVEQYIELGETQKSVSSYLEADKLLEIAGKFTNYGYRYQYSKGRLYTSLVLYDEAELAFQKAFELAPINPILLREWARKYYYNGEYQQAVNILEYHLSLMPEYWQWKNELQTKTTEQKEMYRIFFKHAVNFWDIFYYLAESHIHLGNLDKANFYLQFIKDIKEVASP